MYKFYINDIETTEPKNWSDISFQLAQDPKYFGYFRLGAVEKVELYGDAAKLVKYIYDTEFNPITTFRIDKQTDLGLFVTFQNCVIDYNGYSETLNDFGLNVSIDLIDSNLQGKLRNREGNQVAIGNDKSIENVDVNGFDLIDVLVKKKTLRHTATFTFSEELQKINFYEGAGPTLSYTYYPQTPVYYGEILINGAERAYASTNVRALYNGNAAYGSPQMLSVGGGVPYNFVNLALEVTNTNTDLSNSSYSTNFNTYQAVYNTSGLLVVDCTNKTPYPKSGNMFWKEAGRKRIIKLKGTIKLKVTWRHNIPVTITNRNVGLIIELVSYLKSDNSLDHYDTTIVRNSQQDYTKILHAGGVLDPTSTDTELPQYTTEQIVEFDYNLSLIQTPNETFGFRTSRILHTDLGAHDVVPLLEDNGTSFEVYYDDEIDEFPDSLHKAQLVHECFKSVEEQITDAPNTFNSEYFGRTDIGYSSNGAGSGIAITNGFLLRNGTTIDGDTPKLTLNFTNLYKTMDSIFGLMMFYKNGKIHIEKRNWNRDNTIMLYPDEVSIYPLLERMYTEVIVGNKKMTYDDVNGTYEFNTLLTFSSPLNTIKNTLDLVTDYQIDYNAIENARRLSFQNSQNVDTQYDDKVMVFEVEWNGTNWQTKSIIANFSVIDGLILPYTAYNLGISPKRMLLNNRDLIDAMLAKTTLPLRFEKIDNLVAVESQSNDELNLIVENADLVTENAEFIPEIYELTIGKRNAEVIFENTNNLYSFEYFGVILSGYLYSIEEENSIVKVKLIRKW